MTLLLASTAVPARRKRRFVREAPPAFQLTVRDIALMRLVADHRFLRSTQLSELVQVSMPDEVSSEVPDEKSAGLIGDQPAC
jgi:hypothetical protein